MLRRLWYDEAGLTTIEYVLLFAVLGLAIFTVVVLFGGHAH